tara:strand:+ start:292 stop:474 length:183 start_codon:yes stop_codon:yes gene_type:complete
VVVVVAVLVLAVGPVAAEEAVVPLVLSVDHIMEDSLLPLEAAAVVVVVRGTHLQDLAKLR